LSRIRHRRIAAVASVAATAMLPLAFMPGAAQAVTAGVKNGVLVSYGGQPTVGFTNANGSVSPGLPQSIPNGVDPVWSPDGRRVVYATLGGSLVSEDVYTGSKITLTTPPPGYVDYPGTFSPTGQFMAFTRWNVSAQTGSLYITVTDGTLEGIALSLYSDANGDPIDTGAAEGSPASDPVGTQENDTLLFDRGADIVTADYTVAGNGDASITYTTVVANASMPDFSPDGKYLAFQRKDSNGVSQLWTANADGSNQQQVTTGTEQVSGPKWSPDGKFVAYGLGQGTDERPVTETSSAVSLGNATQLLAQGEGANWQPLNPGVGVVTRVAGGIAIETAIAASQHNYATHGTVGSDGTDSQGRIQAGGVVLSRSNEFYDALAGSAFAADEKAPLLMTPTAGLNPEVQTEIQRVLPKGGTVYLLGGDQALSPAVQAKLQALGYHVQRFAGGDMYATAVLVDQAITGNLPAANVIVATGTQYYDALAAGAAAGATGDTVVVLTKGTTMPPESAAYLNALAQAAGGIPPLTFTAGGPGNTALNTAVADGQVDWGNTGPVLPLVGGDAQQTALLIAKTFFPLEPPTAAVATTHGWYDALTGGAMVAVDDGPLLLTSPTSLDPGVAAYLQQENGSLDAVEVLGGTAAISTTVFNQIANLVALPDGLGGVGGLPLSGGGILGSPLTRTNAAKSTTPTLTSTGSWWSRAATALHRK
jgi:hypothetical protein